MKGITMVSSLVLLAISFAVSVSAFPPFRLADEPQCNFVIEMMHLQDFSSSFSDDLPELAAQLPLILAGIGDTFPGSLYGVGSFTDKPIFPFGFPHEGAWFEGDWCYNVTSPISHDDPQDIVDSLMGMKIGGGRDPPENQIGAIHDVALNASLAGWTDRAHDDNGYPIVRVISFSTDAVYHSAPDGADSVNSLAPNDGDGYTACTEEDYPSVDQLEDAIRSRSIYTIGLIGATNAAIVQDYENLLSDMGTHGHIYPMSSDSSDITEAMITAFTDMVDLVCTTPTLDIVFTHDVTSSYFNDFTGFHTGLDSLTFALQQDYIYPRFGLTTFGDKPLYPLGHGPSGDYCYRVEQVLTYDRSLVITAASGIKNTSGIDWPESQLDAIISNVLDGAMGWRAGGMWNGFMLIRVLVVGTDAGYHAAPDAASAGHELAPHSGGMTVCTEWEYPTWQQAAEALVLAEVHPLFVPTSDIKSIYIDLLGKFEANYPITGIVEELKDFGDLTVVVPAGLKKLEEKIRRLTASPRPAQFVIA